ncbi:MAG: VacJ family lipoprotein [Burkholderiales bacterium]|nr:VacJ family lipoprotein [Burkholderiales bacterium]
MSRLRSAAAGATLAAAALSVVLLGGCATAPASTAPGSNAAAAVAPPRNPDPFENWNRKVYAFNDTVDKAVMKPVAETYRKVVPSLVRTGIDNVLGNIRDVWSAANHLLQGHVETGLNMGMRVLTNTFFGLGGLLDPASEMRLTRQSTDFGLTLGHWGFAPGPYLVLPFVGPSDVRDGLGFIADFKTGPSALPDRARTSNQVTLLDAVNLRAKLLSTTSLIDNVALDPYVFIRDAYLSRRRDAVYDGAPPLENMDDDADSPPAPAPVAAASAPAPAASKPTQ